MFFYLFRLLRYAVFELTTLEKRSWRVLIFALFAVFEQNRENLYREIQFFQKISENCMKTKEFAQNFSGFAKISTREIQFFSKKNYREN